ncbi:MAG: hypothetical protein AAB152_13825 [Candidatus Coatesbacteria bacterium]
MAGLARGLAVLASAFWLVSGPASGMQTATNGYLTVKVSDDPAAVGGPGLFTVETGPLHPTPGKSIFYNSVANQIGTSYITVMDTDANTLWVNAVSNTTMVPSEAGYGVQRMGDYPVTLAALGASGFRATYILPKFTVIQDVVIMGTALMNTSVMHQVTVTNTSGSDLHFGVRYLWDWMVNAIDSSYFRPLNPPGPYTDVFEAFDDPVFDRYEASDSETFPSFEIYGTTHGGSLLSEPRQPDQIRYAYWGDARRAPWDFPVAGQSSDSAIVYYWGLTAPLTLAPGSSTTFTQYVTANLYALRRAIPEIKLALSNTLFICAGDAVTYSIEFRNKGDATSENLTITETVPAAMQYAPGSLEFWAGTNGGVPPAVAATAWASNLNGPWTPGEPPVVFAPDHLLRWVVDRLGPDQSGYIRFVMNAEKGVSPGLTLISSASATNALDSSVFRSGNVKNETLSAILYKVADPSLLDAGNGLRYTLEAWCPCATTIYDVTVHDTLPAGMDLAEPYGLHTDGVVTGTRYVSWSIGDLAPGASRYVYFDAVANGDVATPRNWGAMDYSALRNGTLEAQPRLLWFADVDVNLPKFWFRKMLWPPTGQTPAAPDGQVQFVLDIGNDRNVTLTNVTMWDSLPPGMSYLSDTGGASVAGDLVTWNNVPDIHPGDRWSVFMTVQLSGSCYTLGPNTARLGFTLDPIAAPFVPTPPASSGDVPIPLAQPIVTTVRSPNPSVVPPGELLTYTISMWNEGKAKASSVSVWDSLPARSTFVDASPGYVYTPGTPGTVVWNNIPDIVTDAHEDVWYTVRVDTSPVGMQALTSWVSYSGVAGCTTFQTPVWDMYVFKAQPKFEMSKFVDQGIVPVGGIAIWSFSITNTGNDSALNVVVSDALPTGLAYTGCSGPPGWTCSQSGNVAIWTTPMLPAGYTGTVSFVTTVVDDTVPSCTMTIDGNNFGNNIGTVTFENRVAQPRGPAGSTVACLRTGDAALYLEKVPNYNPVTQDTTLTWWFTMSNTGALAASNIVLWDTLPAGGDYIGCGGAPCSRTGNLVVWQIPDLAAGARAQVYVTLTAREGMACTNFGEASYTNPIGFDRPRVTAVGPCVPVVLPVLEVSKWPTKSVYANGEPVTFALSYTNVGTGIANKVRLTDFVGADMRFVNATLSSSGDPWSTVLTGSTVDVVWDLGSVSPGQYGTASVTLMPMLPSATQCESGSFLNHAQIKYEKETGVWLSTDTGMVPAMVNDTAVALVLSASPPVADAGSQVTYTLSIQNTCEGTVTNLAVWDSLPAGVGFAGADSGGTLIGGVVSWSLPSIPPYGVLPVTFTVTVTGVGPWIGPDTAETDFANGAGLHQPRALSNTVWIGVLSPMLSMTKTASPVPVPADAALTYRLAVRNIGIMSAVSIQVWDTLPAGMSFLGCQGGASCSFDGTRVTWQVPDLPPGASVDLTVSVTASSTAGCPKTNVAQGDYGVPGAPWRIALTSNAVCVPVVHSELALGITADRPVHASGDLMVYTILCSNLGTDTAVSLEISDAWPPGAAFWSGTPGGSAVPGGREWALPDLPPGTSATVYVSLRSPAVSCTPVVLPHDALARFTNSSGIVQPDVGPVTATVTVTGVMLVLGLSPAATVVQQGAAVAYALTWSNPCSDTAWNVSLWDTVPGDAAYAGSSGGGTFLGGLLAWSPGTVPPGSAGAVTFTLSWVGEGPDLGLPPAQAGFASSNGAAALAPSNPATVTVLRPVVTVEKRGPSGVVKDGRVRYVLTVRNAGTDTAFAIRVVDTMPAPLKYAGASPPAAIAGPVMSWSLTGLEIGGTAVITVDALGPPGEEDAETVNCAIATWLTPLGIAGESAPSCVTVVLSPDLVVRIFPNPFEPAKAVRGTMKFTGLPEASYVSLYTLTGVRMRLLTDVTRHALEWDGRNEDGSPVAAGVYLYVVEMPDGKGGKTRLKGKFGLIR